MGMHFGLVAVRASVPELRALMRSAWPALQEVGAFDAHESADAIWQWLKSNEVFVSSAEWAPENRGVSTAFLCKSGAWAVVYDPRYTLALDKKALASLSEAFTVAHSFVVETASAFASFASYERGESRREINWYGEAIESDGVALPEEAGIVGDVYYMEETERLMTALGLGELRKLPDVPSTTTVSLMDMADYSKSRRPRKSQPASAGNPPAPIKRPWWKLW